MALGSGCTLSTEPVTGIRTVRCARWSSADGHRCVTITSPDFFTVGPTASSHRWPLITDAQNRTTLNTTPTANTSEPTYRHEAKCSLNAMARRSITSMLADRPTTGSLAGIRWPAAITIAPIVMTASPSAAYAPLQCLRQRISGSTWYLKSSSCENSFHQNETVTSVIIISKKNTSNVLWEYSFVWTRARS